MQKNTNSNNSERAVKLKMVVVPAIKGEMEAQFKTLISIIEDITGYSIIFEEAASYQDAIESLSSKSAHLAWLGANAFLEGAHKADIEAFAVAVRGKEEMSTYRTIFVVRFDSDISDLSGVKGKTIVFSQKGSTSGDLMPRHELIKNGISTEVATNFKDLIYSGSHEASITSVLSGTADVAAVSEINYERLIGAGILRESDLKIIHTSPAMPGAPLVYSKHLPIDVRAKLKDAVLNAHKFGKVSGYGEDIVRYETKEEAKEDFLLSYLRPQWGWKVLASLGIFVTVIVLINIHLKINPIEAIDNSIKYLWDLMTRMFPPDFSNIKELLVAMLETIEIGVLGTVLAIILAIPVGLLSARNVSKNKLVYFVFRTITIFFRSIPEFIMAMILVIAVGFGALPGVLALALHTMGFLAKFYAEEIEHVSTGPIEALESTGANGMQVIMFSIIPQVIPSFVGFNLYILDRNIRMATMLGIVGVGGIGYKLQSSFRMFHYKEVTSIIIIIFITIYIIDIISSKLRMMVK